MGGISCEEALVSLSLPPHQVNPSHIKLNINSKLTHMEPWFQFQNFNFSKPTNPGSLIYKFVSSHIGISQKYDLDQILCLTCIKLWGCAR